MTTKKTVPKKRVAVVTGGTNKKTDVQGQVVSGSLGKTQSFTPTGTSSKTVEDISTGTVKIYNNLSFAQALVATTRLLSQEGVLFRLKSAVTIPAGGSVDAPVYADLPGVSGDIKPTRFT